MSKWVTDGIILEMILWTVDVCLGRHWFLANKSHFVFREQGTYRKTENDCEIDSERNEFEPTYALRSKHFDCVMVVDTYERRDAAQQPRGERERHTHLRLRSHKKCCNGLNVYEFHHLTFPKFLASRRLHRRCCCRSRRRRRWCQWNHYRRMSFTWDEKQKSDGAHRQEESEKEIIPFCHSNSEQQTAREYCASRLATWHYILDKCWNDFCCVDARGPWLVARWYRANFGTELNRQRNTSMFCCGKSI